MPQHWCQYGCPTPHAGVKSKLICLLGFMSTPTKNISACQINLNTKGHLQMNIIILKWPNESILGMTGERQLKSLKKSSHLIHNQHISYYSNPTNNHQGTGEETDQPVY